MCADGTARQEMLTRLLPRCADIVERQLAIRHDLVRARVGIDIKLDATYWKVMAGVAVLLLANVAVTWGIVASYAMRSPG